MNKLHNAIYFAFLVILQISVTIVIGISATYMIDKKFTDRSMSTFGISLRENDEQDTGETIINAVKEQIAEKLITIKYDKDSFYNIRLSELDPIVDYDVLISRINEYTSDKSIKTFLSRIFNSKENRISLNIRIDEKKLATLLSELESIIAKEPSNAFVEFKEGKVVKYDHEYGRKLNIDSVKAKVNGYIKNNESGAIELKNGTDILPVLPVIRSSDIEGIQEIISEYSTAITNTQDTLSIHIASKAIDGVYVPAKGSFSFNKYVFGGENPDESQEKENAGYNQTASTLYAALLLSGIEKSDIESTRNSVVPNYISPGLDVSIYKGEKDLKFTNSLGQNIMIFSKIEKDYLKVFIAGKKKNDNTIELTPEITQKFVPGTVTKINGSLELGETVVINPGSEGMQVRVSRNIKNSKGTITEVVSTDIYEAVDRMIEIGANHGIIK